MKNRKSRSSQAEVEYLIVSFYTSTRKCFIDIARVLQYMFPLFLAILNNFNSAFISLYLICFDQFTTNLLGLLYLAFISSSLCIPSASLTSFITLLHSMILYVC